MTVLARTVRATPYRPADEAWEVIVGLLAPGGGAARDELMKVAGVATSLIAAEAPKDDKIVVWGGGPPGPDQLHIRRGRHRRRRPRGEAAPLAHRR